MHKVPEQRVVPVAYQLWRLEYLQMRPLPGVLFQVILDPVPGAAGRYNPRLYLARNGQTGTSIYFSDQGVEIGQVFVSFQAGDAGTCRQYVPPVVAAGATSMATFAPHSYGVIRVHLLIFNRELVAHMPAPRLEPYFHIDAYRQLA